MNTEITPNIYYRILEQHQVAQLLFEAIQLDIFSYLDSPTRGSEIVKKTGYDQQNTELLLLALSSCGLIIEKDKGYCNTESGKAYLSKKSPHYIGQTILFRESMTSLQGIETLVKHGSKEDAPINYDFAKLAEVTAPEMYATGRVDNFISEIKSIFTDEAQAYRMLDLGGGSGILAIEFAKNYPKSKAYVFEFPDVAPVTEKIIAKHSVQQQVSVLEGDFNTDGIGDNYNLIVASGILDFTTDDLDSFISKIAMALSTDGYFLLVGRCTITEGYPRENILSWLSGYMNDIKPPPTQSRLEEVLEKAQLQFVRLIQSGRFQGILYKKGI